MPEISRKQTVYNKNLVIKFLDNWKPPSTFNEFEDEIIKKYYPTRPASAIARALNKKAKQVSNRAETLGLRKK